MAASPTEPVREERQRSVLPFSDVLSETAHLLLQDADPDTICQAVFKQLREPLAIDVYFHFLVAEDESCLELASSGGNAEARDVIGTRLDFGSAVCGTVARQCAPMYVTCVSERNDRLTALIRSMGVRCYACYPLMSHGKVLGTLSFGSTRRDEFSQQEMDVFALVAQQITIATERRAQSERVRQLERLAMAGRMSATLAHEINNPLESLGNLLHLLHDEVHDDDAELLVDQAESQVRQLAQTVQRTLELFRGKQQDPRVTDLSELVRELVSGLHLPNHARLESEIEDKLCVKVIPGELRQVLFNLLMNAAQFTPVGKPVWLVVRRAGQTAEVRVRDEGPGISEASRSKLFQPFYTTKGKEGTGVGLWLSREMIERAGGRLVFHSDPELHAGTEFVATLPLAE